MKIESKDNFQLEIPNRVETVSKSCLVVEEERNRTIHEFPAKNSTVTELERPSSEAINFQFLVEIYNDAFLKIRMINVFVYCYFSVTNFSL